MTSNKKVDDKEITKVKKPRKRSRKKVKNENQPLKYFMAIIADSLFFYVFNHLFDWNIFFLTFDFQKVLPSINLAIGVAIFCNILLIFDNEGKFGNFLRLVKSLFGIFFAYTVYRVFPFDLTSLPNAVLAVSSLKIALLSLIVSFGVATIIRFFKFSFEK